MRKQLIRASSVFALAIALIGSASPAAAQRSGYVVPDNTLIEGTLNTLIEAEDVRAGEPFTLTVTSPNRFRGATVHGRVYDAKRSGRIAGKSEVALIFDRIQMRNGRSYRFAGDVQAVRTPDGEDFDVEQEGVVEGDSQTERTVKRSAIGALAGTIIGAIADGGSGAAVGAAVGGGIGAGSVLVQGRRSLTLEPGTRLTIRSSAPR
jgi:hypothetical protein